MKLRSLLLNSVATFLTLADPAHAGELALAIAAIATKGGVAAALLKGALVIGAQLGMSLYQRAKAKKAQKDQQRGVNVSVRTGDDNAIEFPIGKSSTPGIRSYAGSWGQEGKTPNAYFTDVLEISCLPVPGLAGMWAGDKRCTVLWDQPTPTGMGCPVQEYRVNGVDYMWVKFVDGTQTVADPFLRATFGNDATRPYKDTMIGRGLAYVIVTTRLNPDLFPNGKPEYLFEPSPPVFYDLRKDSTAGGSGPHRWNDRSTWEPTENNAVIIYNIIRGIYYGTEWVFGGRDLSPFRLPASNWMAAANECDRQIALKGGGTEKQFRCGMQVYADMEPLELVEELLKGCNGRLSECGGVFYLLVGAPGAAVYSFTDDQIVRTSDEELDPFPAPTEINNGIEATFPEPADRWVMRDAPARYDAALEAADDGHRRVNGVQFRAVPYALTVQRLMETMLRDGRRFVVHTASLPPETKPLLPNNVVSWTSARNGYTNKKFLIVAKTGAQGFRQQVLLREIDPSDHGWSTDKEVPPSIGHVGPAPIPPQPMTGWSAVKDTIKSNSGTSRRVAIRVGCTGELDDIVAVHVLVRVKLTNQVVFDNSGSTPYPAPGTNAAYSWLLSGDWCLPATAYLVEGAFVPRSRRTTVFSEPIEVTTDDIRLGPDDVFLPGMLDELEERLKGLHEWLGAGTRDLIESSRKNVLLDIDADVGRYAQVQMVRQEVTATAQGVSAKATAELLAATGAGSAIAQSLTALNAAVFDPTTGLSPTAAALVATTARVTTAEGRINTLSQNLVDLTTTVGSKASATALSLLQTQVTQQGETLMATSNSLNSLTTTVGKFSANGMFRISVEATPAGSRSRIGLSAAADGVEGSSAAALFLEAIAGGKSIAVVEADAFYVRNGTGREPVFAVSGGVVRMILAYIGTVRSARLLSLNEKVDFNLDAGRLIFKS